MKWIYSYNHSLLDFERAISPLSTVLLHCNIEIEIYLAAYTYTPSSNIMKPIKLILFASLVSDTHNKQYILSTYAYIAHYLLYTYYIYFTSRTHILSKISGAYGSACELCKTTLTIEQTSGQSKLYAIQKELSAACSVQDLSVQAGCYSVTRSLGEKLVCIFTFSHIHLPAENELSF